MQHSFVVNGDACGGSTCVSVVVPIYNKAPYLRICLDSLAGQTLRDIEIIMVDDASTDRSADIAQQYAKDDHRFRLLRHSENRGPAAAQNTGLAAASGRYLSVVGADDWIDATMLQSMYDVAISYGVDVVRCGFIIEPDLPETVQSIDAKTVGSRQPAGPIRRHPTEVTRIANGAELYRRMFGKIDRALLPVSTALHRRGFILEHGICFDTQLRNMEDVLFNARVFALNPQIVLLPDWYYHGLVSHNSISHHPVALSNSARILAQRIRELEAGSPVARALHSSFLRYRLVLRAIIIRNWFRAHFLG